MTANFTQDTIRSPSGAALRLCRIIPDQPRAIVQINHGMAEHAARYERFARSLAAAGLGVYAHDHRGHGVTTAADAPQGVFGARGEGFAKVIADVDAVNAHIRAAHDVPVICFGHSMGSIIALNYALRHPAGVDGLCCWNAGVETGLLAVVSRLVLGAEALLRGRDRPSVLAPRLTFDAWNKVFKPNRTGFDWLSRDPAEVDKYVADPLCGFDVSTGLWLDLLGAIRFAADDRNLGVLRKDLPVHLTGGGVDPCSNKGRDMAHLGRRLGAAGLGDVTVSILPETRHESLNEINRETTTAAFIAWARERFGG